MTDHDAKVQEWYNARRDFLDAAYIESGKRTQNSEWLAGETPQKYVADQLESWLGENPFPEA